MAFPQVGGKKVPRAKKNCEKSAGENLSALLQKVAKHAKKPHILKPSYSLVTSDQQQEFFSSPKPPKKN